MYRNSEGYPNPTEAVAFSHIIQEEKRKKKVSRKRRVSGRQVDVRIRKSGKYNR